MNRIHLIRKIGFPTLWYVFYYNIWFLLFAPNIYNDIGHLAILIVYIIAYADSFARPFSEKEEITDKYSLLLLIAFLLNPLIYILAFSENQLIISRYFSFWNNEFIFAIGIVLVIVGGVINVSSRIQLGRYGSGMLVIEDDHKLVTRGFYRYIRHPIYLGGALVGLGAEMSFRSIVVPLLGLVYSFLIFKPRMDQEERLLAAEFGEEYEMYLEQTKRLVPFIY